MPTPARTSLDWSEGDYPCREPGWPEGERCSDEACRPSDPPDTAPSGPSSSSTRTTPQASTPTGTPARDLPNGMWFDVHDTLVKHGLRAPAGEVMLAVHRLIEATPIADGGRLLPDGTVDKA